MNQEPDVIPSDSTPSPVRYTQFVLKVSKFCNLRCTYCYEMPNLGDRTQFSRDQLQQLYRNIAPYYRMRAEQDNRPTEIRFIWHGGEPLLVHPAFYWDTFADQQEIFGVNQPIANYVQTNLTVLDDERLRLLREGFAGTGVSLDLYGGLRRNLAGNDQQTRVLRNMDVLKKENIPFGCITVLTKKNIGRIKEICEFYARAGLGFRLLPLFDGAYEDQHQQYEITTQELVQAYQQVVDFWLQTDRTFAVSPVRDYIDIVVWHLTEGAGKRYYNKRLFNPALLVNVNGDCYSSGDPYGDPNWCVGNLFTTSLQEILMSPQMEKSYTSAERKMAQNCVRCRFFGSCSGFPIVEELSNNRERSVEGLPICTVEQYLFEYIEMRLRAAGLPERMPAQVVVQQEMPPALA